MPSGFNNNLTNTIRRIGEKIGNELLNLDFHGIVSIDGMLTNDALFPIVEINGRASLSTYTSFDIEKLNYKYISTKYYNYYLENTNFFDKLDVLISTLEHHNSSESKIIIYSYANDTTRYINGKYRCRIFVMFLYNDEDALEELLKYYEKYANKIMY